MSSFDPGRRPVKPPRRWRWRRWIPFVIVLAVVVSAICAATFRVPNGIFFYIDRYPGIDKAGHFGLIGAMALALNWALGGRIARWGSISVQLGGLLVGLAITVEEVSQLWVSTRSFDWGDLIANYAGIACADWLARRRLRSVRE